MKPVNEHVARMLGLVLNGFGIPASTANDVVSEKGLAFRIIPECTPIFTAGLFLCFVLFYTATPREKATGLLMGIPALYLGNLARLTATFMISRHDRRFFEVAHVYLGQVFTILLVIVACIVWLRWLDRKESPKSIPMKAAGFLARFCMISGCLFLVWLKVHHWYIWFLDRFMLFGFSLFNYRVPLARQTVYYYETFSIVVFTSLVLAAWSLPWKMKVKGLAAGIGLLFVTHLIHRVNNVLLAYFNFTAIVPVDLTLLVIGQYLLPVLFLIYLVRLRRQDIRAVST
jgi:exosortase H (IPTLxxWG-CTERM-specific)